MVHSTQGSSRYSSDPSRYKGKSFVVKEELCGGILWGGVVVHVKVLCVASQKDMIQMGTNHSYTPFWDQFKFVIKLDVQSICSSSSPPPLHYDEGLWQWNVESPQKHMQRLSHGNPEFILCVDMGRQM